jgi:hypothetical protein
LLELTDFQVPPRTNPELYSKGEKGKKLEVERTQEEWKVEGVIYVLVIGTGSGYERNRYA